MKILLYFEGRKYFNKYGLTRAYNTQKKALELCGYEVLTDVKRLDYEVLFVHTYGLHAQKMIKKAKKMGKKIVIFARSTQEDFQDSFIGSNAIGGHYKKYLTNFYQMADFLITPTEYARNLLQSYGIRVPITVISNGVDLPKYTPNPFKEKAFRDIFDIKKEEKVVIGVGMYFERKGILDFVEVAKKMPDVRFIWLGSTPKMSIPPHVRSVIAKNHPQNVEFPGYIKGDILEGAYSACHCFFCPSYEEMEGVVVLEALASKQKIVVRDIPAYQGWLFDEENCLKANNNETFVKKINTMLHSPKQYLRDEAFITAQLKSIPEISKQLSNLFEEIMKR